MLSAKAGSIPVARHGTERPAPVTTCTDLISHIQKKKMNSYLPGELEYSCKKQEWDFSGVLSTNVSKSTLTAAVAIHNTY